MTVSKNYSSIFLWLCWISCCINYKIHCNLLVTRLTYRYETSLILFVEIFCFSIYSSFLRIFLVPLLGLYILSLTFKCNNFASWIHDGRICWNWTSSRICVIIHIDNDHLCGIIDLFAHTNEFVRLHGESTERYPIDVNTDICELQIRWRRYKVINFLSHNSSCRNELKINKNDIYVNDLKHRLTKWRLLAWFAQLRIYTII